MRSNPKDVEGPEDPFLARHERVLDRVRRYPNIARLYDKNVLDDIWRYIDGNRGLGCNLTYPDLYFSLMKSSDVFLQHIDYALSFICGKADKTARRDLKSRLGNPCGAAGGLFEVQVIAALAEHFGEEAVLPYPKTERRTNAPRLDCALDLNGRQVGFECTLRTMPGEVGRWGVRFVSPEQEAERAFRKICDKACKAHPDGPNVICLSVRGPTHNTGFWVALFNRLCREVSGPTARIAAVYLFDDLGVYQVTMSNVPCADRLRLSGEEIKEVVSAFVEANDWCKSWS